MGQMASPRRRPADPFPPRGAIGPVPPEPDLPAPAPQDPPRDEPSAAADRARSTVRRPSPSDSFWSFG